MPSNARTWVYQANRSLELEEIEKIKIAASHFLADWAAHGNALNATFDVLYDRFLVLMVDEVSALASGCSIDASVKFIKELEQVFSISLFDRMTIVYKHGDKLFSCSMEQFEELLGVGEWNENTIVFKNTITTKEAFENAWEVPVKNSWHKRALTA